MKNVSIWLTAVFLVALCLGTMAQRASAAPSPCNPDVARYDVSIPGHPFSSVQSADGQSLFVSVTSSSPILPNGIAVLRCRNGKYSFSSLVPVEPQPTGMARTHDGELLLVADDEFIVFIDTAKALRGESAVLGFMQDLEGETQDDDPGSVYVNVTSDDHYAFVSEEQASTVTVIDLRKARANGFDRKAIVGEIPVGDAPIALSFSRDEKYLFTTSEYAQQADNFSASCGRPMGPGQTRDPVGVAYAIDVAKAETDPAHSIVGKTPAGCSPVRMDVSPDGSTAWVTNRGSNTVMAYSTAKLAAGVTPALIATVPVGPNPVPIAVTSDGRYVLVGNSNRAGGTAQGNQTVSVISTADHTVVGSIPVGLFPRDFSHGIGGLLFLTNYNSNALTVIDTDRLTSVITAPR